MELRLQLVTIFNSTNELDRNYAPSSDDTQIGSLKKINPYSFGILPLYVGTVIFLKRIIYAQKSHT